MIYIVKTAKKVVKAFSTREEANDYIKAHTGKNDYIVKELSF